MYFLLESHWLYRLYCNRLGDEESLSLELIQFLALRGARKFVLVSTLNKKSSSGYRNLTLRRLKNKNIHVVLSLADPSTVRGAEDVLREAITLGPVGGIYYISTVRTVDDLCDVKKFIKTRFAQLFTFFFCKNRLPRPVFCNRWVKTISQKRKPPWPTQWLITTHWVGN